jgi:hypothetical protein
MRLWLALAVMLLVSAPAGAQMQCVEVRNPTSGEVMRLCGGDMTPPRPRECDNRGCYFDKLKKWQSTQDAYNLRRELLQRRAEEALKKFNADRLRSD